MPRELSGLKLTAAQPLTSVMSPQRGMDLQRQAPTYTRHQALSWMDVVKNDPSNDMRISKVIYRDTAFLRQIVTFNITTKSTVA